jgi:hypothetical protein
MSKQEPVTIVLRPGQELRIIVEDASGARTTSSLRAVGSPDWDSPIPSGSPDWDSPIPSGSPDWDSPIPSGSPDWDSPIPSGSP